MRLPMLSRKLNRSYSGGGYDSALGGASSGSETDERHRVQQSAGESAQQRMARPQKKKRKRKANSSEGSGASPPGRVLWLVLVAGLLFCWLDVLYIMQFVASDHRGRSSKHSSSSGDHSIHSIQAAGASDSHKPLPPVDMKTRQVQQLESDWPPDETGKEPILRLLQEALGKQEIDPETVDRIPMAKDFTDLYGSAPVVLGLETCEHFQRYNGDPAGHFVSTAGTFNTGTNLMAELLIANCHMPARMAKYGPNSRGVRWQVLWGKHTPVFDEEFRQHHRTYNDSSLTASSIFPAVTVRDPFKWMQSMCRHAYSAHWPHDKDRHCPNLVLNDVDRALLQKKGQALAEDGAVNVTVNYAEFHQHHDSLVHFFNDWYRDYVKAPFPRLIVRFEDIIFHPKLITRTVCECAGGEMNRNKPFKYIVDSAKKGAAHGAQGQRTSYVDALVKYGTEAGRYKGFEEADLEYAKQHLDPDLMRLFGYRFPSS